MVIPIRVSRRSVRYRDRPIHAAFFDVGDGDGGRGPGGRGSDDRRIADARTRARRRLGEAGDDNG